MHFFYLDETGCTGSNLDVPQQPIFVIGGLSVSDERWRRTTDAFDDVVTDFFNSRKPQDFQLHAHELINQEGPFEGRTQDECNALAHQLLDVVKELKHAIHFVAIDKKMLSVHANGKEHDIVDCRHPYLLGFNYLVTAIERHVGTLGRSAKAMIIIDEKEMYQKNIEKLTRYRRYEVPKVRRLNRIVEFSYPVDSEHHPLVQLSDLIIYLTRKFLEYENGYREAWLPEARNFFASCYDKIIERALWKTLIEMKGQEEADAYKLLTTCRSTHRQAWRKYYQLPQG